MPKKINRYDFVFDGQAFKDMIAEHYEVWHEISELTEISEKTLKSWIAPTGFKQQFPYPSMTNFLKICNICDANPQDFFVLDTDE